MAIIVLALFMVAPGNATVEKTIIDDSGREITFNKPFKRIISLYAAHTENLFQLGLDSEIIGISPHEDYPEKALSRTVYSYRDDPEKFIAAQPDLVLIRPMIYRGYRNLVERLEDAGIKTISLQPSSVDDMFVYWEKLGELTGRETQAEKMIADFKNGVESKKSLTMDIPVEQRKQVYFESIHSKMKTFSPNAMPIFALECAGGVNIASDAKSINGSLIAQYGKERILSHAPRIDVFLAQYGAMNPVRREDILEEPGFMAVKAIKENQVYIVDEKIVSRPTIRLLKGIQIIGRCLYPERFENTK